MMDIAFQEGPGKRLMWLGCSDFLSTRKLDRFWESQVSGYLVSSQPFTSSEECSVIEVPVFFLLKIRQFESPSWHHNSRHNWPCGSTASSRAGQVAIQEWTVSGVVGPIDVTGKSC